MGDSESIAPNYDPYEGEQHVIDAAKHVVKALVMSNSVNTELRKILVDLDTHLSTMTKHTKIDERGNHEPQDHLICSKEKVINWQCEAGSSSEVEDKLIYAQKKLIRWQSNQSMIWDSGPQEASEYLQAVDEVRRLAESLGSLFSNRDGKEKELLDQAEGVLEMAMERLKEELIHILVQNKQSFEPECSPLHICDENGTFEESFVSTEDYLVEVSSWRMSSAAESELYITDLLHPVVISDIKSIASVMFASNYSQEFCEAFVSFWRDALQEYLLILGVDILSIGDVLKMDWSILNLRIKKWCRAMKIVIQSILPNEKRLFDQVLGKFHSITSSCFLDATRTSVLCLLNFGEAIALGSHQPERLFRTIDMYEVLAYLLQDIDVLFEEEAGYLLKTEFHKLLMNLADSVRQTVREFGNQIALCTSTIPFPRGGVHHLTRYVMNYITALVEYGDTLSMVLEETNHAENFSSEVRCPVARCLQSVTLMLETNLHHKSHLYRDSSLKHIFMMNNIHYMVKKVDGSKLRTYIGYEWIRKHIGKFRDHATSYERATWSPVLSFLRDEGASRKTNLKERYRGFNIAFEEVYKCQTAWDVPDGQLREDLKIRTLQMVIPAYRACSGGTSKFMSDKYIRYTTDDLQNYIMDLFEGSPKTLSSFWRR